MDVADQHGTDALSAPPRFTDPPLRFSWPAAIGFAALCILVSYPGRLNADSLFAVVAAGMPGEANNWHSATLGWLWSLPGALLGQPLGALAVQAALFGIFAGFLPRVAATPRRRIALALELLLRVGMAGGAGYVGKDAVIALTLLIAVQLLRHARHAGYGPASGAALAAVAALFLLIKAPDFLVVVAAVALILPFFVRSPGRYAALVAATLAVGSLAVPLNRMVDRVVFAARDVHPDKQLVIFDLAGISVRTGDNAFAKVPGWPAKGMPPLASCFLPYMWDAFAFWAPCGAYSAAYDRLDGALTRRWLTEIAAHPLAYAQHRLTYLGYLLQSRDHATWGIGGQAINDATDPGARAEMARLMAALHPPAPIGLWRPSPATPPMRWLEAALFRFPKVQWAGLIACLTVLLWCWKRRTDGVRFGAILAAGLGAGNVAMLAVFGVADPGRYMWPTVCLAYVALLALLAPGGRGRPGSQSAAGSAPSAGRSNQASTGPDSLMVRGLPWRSTFLPSATRIQLSGIEYSSTS